MEGIEAASWLTWDMRGSWMTTRGEEEEEEDEREWRREEIGERRWWMTVSQTGIRWEGQL